MSLSAGAINNIYTQTGDLGANARVQVLDVKKIGASGAERYRWALDPP